MSSITSIKGMKLDCTGCGKTTAMYPPLGGATEKPFVGHDVCPSCRKGRLPGSSNPRTARPNPTSAPGRGETRAAVQKASTFENVPAGKKPKAPPTDMPEQDWHSNRKKAKEARIQRGLDRANARAGRLSKIAGKGGKAFGAIGSLTNVGAHVSAAKTVGSKENKKAPFSDRLGAYVERVLDMPAGSTRRGKLPSEKKAERLL